MRIGSLFSGAGGLDIAVQSVFGGYVAWHSEINEAASKVLAHNNPDTPNIGDITCIDWDVWAEIHPEVVVPVDIVCGGWPCQPFSIAGNQKGIHDHRALWPYVARSIRALRPRIVVLENVPAVLTVGEFDRVADDLAQAGYDFAWTCFRASSVGAPHRRERLFVVAHSDNPGRGEQRGAVSAPQELPALEHDCDGDVFGEFGPAVRRWEQMTRPAPSPTVLNQDGTPWLNAAFSEWLMGWPAGWVTDPAIGISRNDQLRIVGNGVVPQQAEAALRYLLEVPA